MAYTRHLIFLLGYIYDLYYHYDLKAPGFRQCQLSRALYALIMAPLPGTQQNPLYFNTTTP